MPDLVSARDLKRRALERANEPVDDTSDWDDEAGRAVIEAHRRVVARFAWISLEKYPPAVVLVPAPITTLTLTTTAGSRSASLSASPGRVLTDYMVKPQSADYALRITAHASSTATAITLDPAEGGAPETLSAVACDIFQIEVNLPSDFNFALNAAWTHGGTPIPILSDERLRWDPVYRQADPPRQSWPPRAAARIGRTKLRFSSYPDARKRVEIPYTFDPGDVDPSSTTALDIDRHLRSVVAQLALPAVLKAKRAFAEAAQELAIGEAMLEEAVRNEERLRLARFGSLSREAAVSPWA